MNKVNEMLKALERELRQKRQYSAADKLLPIIEEAEKTSWIPCKEELPKKAGFYLVTKKLQKGMKPLVCKEYFEPSKGWADLGNGSSVLAWMPKIEPWKCAFDE